MAEISSMIRLISGDFCAPIRTFLHVICDIFCNVNKLKKKKEKERKMTRSASHICFLLTKLSFKNASTEIHVCHHKYHHQQNIENHNHQLSQLQADHHYIEDRCFRRIMLTFILTLETNLFKSHLVMKWNNPLERLSFCSLFRLSRVQLIYN